VPKLTLETVKILVIGDRVWGKGDTLREALKKAGNPRRYIAYLCEETTKVDPDGCICFPTGMRPREFHRVPMEKRQKGKPCAKSHSSPTPS
jgi:hypothetical protein